MQITFNRFVWVIHVLVLLGVWTNTLFINTDYSIQLEKVLTGLMRFSLCYVLFFLVAGWILKGIWLLLNSGKDRN
ncbi:hypothetical protein [Noviherbaspirillum malthae]|uniref:hypothetical protein n=1 Tax=Noviherbaspirillum malthae TaxID=1260987 RepID=UPI001890820D|nr:hypothetical protein [Noviherbaspirillum malthae]